MYLIITMQFYGFVQNKDCAPGTFVNVFYRNVQGQVAFHELVHFNKQVYVIAGMERFQSNVPLPQQYVDNVKTMKELNDIYRQHLHIFHTKEDLYRKQMITQNELDSYDDIRKQHLSVMESRPRMLYNNNQILQIV